MSATRTPRSGCEVDCSSQRPSPCFERTRRRSANRALGGIPGSRRALARSLEKGDAGHRPPCGGGQVEALEHQGGEARERHQDGEEGKRDATGGRGAGSRAGGREPGTREGRVHPASRWRGKSGLRRRAAIPPPSGGRGPVPWTAAGPSGREGNRTDLRLRAFRCPTRAGRGCRGPRRRRVRLALAPGAGRSPGSERGVWGFEEPDRLRASPESGSCGRGESEATGASGSADGRSARRWDRGSG